MPEDTHLHLSRRERQIMDVLYAQPGASAADIQAAMPNSPSYSTVRALLRKLLDKGHVTFREDGPRYLYEPVVSKAEASSGAVRRLVDTFFAGDRAAAVVGLLGRSEAPLSSTDIEQIEAALARLKAGRDAD
ncbi:MAG: BlaI/MecI/CopY family transcriptional regulator [Pseudomonadota bacterium]